MPSSAWPTSVKGFCVVNLEFQGQSLKLFISSERCVNLTIGHDRLKEDECLELSFGRTITFFG